MAFNPPTNDQDNIIDITAAQLPGSILDGKGGNDTLNLLGGGDFYLTPVIDGRGNNAAPAQFISIETVQGSADTIDRIYVGGDQLSIIRRIDGGTGSPNLLTLAGTALDLRNTTIANISLIEVINNDATVTVSDLDVASLLRAKNARNDHLVLQGITLTDAQFADFHRAGFDRVTDATGRTSVDLAPTVTGVDPTPREIRNDRAVSVDPTGAISLKDDFGPIAEIRIANAKIGSPAGQFDLVATDRISIGGTPFMPEVLFDNVSIGRFENTASGLSVKFSVDATDAMIGAVLKAMTVRLNSFTSSDTGYEDVTVSAVDAGGRVTSKTMTFYKVYDANGSGTQGGPLADVLIGSAGRDVLWGRGGDDVLYGKGGQDMLVGFQGKDAFVFDTKLTKLNADRISDYNVRDDSIWLDNAVFTKLGKKGSADAPAKISKAFFVTGDKAKDKNDYLIYNKTKGTLSYDADGSGTKFKPVEIATFLTKKLALTHNDFFVI